MAAMKTLREFVALSQAHYHAVKLALDVKQATASGDSERIAAAAERVVGQMAGELEAHFRLEETLLLPAMKEAGHAGMTSRALVEHRLMRDAAASLAMPSASLLESFADLLLSHVRFEEEQVFPAARGCLDDDTLAAIAAY